MRTFRLLSNGTYATVGLRLQSGATFDCTVSQTWAPEVTYWYKSCEVQCTLGAATRVPIWYGMLTTEVLARISESQNLKCQSKGILGLHSNPKIPSDWFVPIVQTDSSTQVPPVPAEIGSVSQCPSCATQGRDRK